MPATTTTTQEKNSMTTTATSASSIDAIKSKAKAVLRSFNDTVQPIAKNRSRLNNNARQTMLSYDDRIRKTLAVIAQIEADQGDLASLATTAKTLATARAEFELLPGLARKAFMNLYDEAQPLRQTRPNITKEKNEASRLADALRATVVAELATYRALGNDAPGSLLKYSGIRAGWKVTRSGPAGGAMWLESVLTSPELARAAETVTPDLYKLLEKLELVVCCPDHAPELAPMTRRLIQHKTWAAADISEAVDAPVV